MKKINKNIERQRNDYNDIFNPRYCCGSEDVYPITYDRICYKNHPKSLMKHIITECYFCSICKSWHLSKIKKIDIPNRICGCGHPKHFHKKNSSCTIVSCKCKIFHNTTPEEKEDILSQKIFWAMYNFF